MLRLNLAFAACLLAGTVPARADQGETYADFVIAPELAWLSHPAVHEASASPFDPSASFTFLPRIGGGLRYGLTNDLHLGIAADGAVFTNLAARGVSVENTTGDLITGTYVELLAPILLTWRLDSGSDFTGLIELQGGPLLTGWLANVLVDPEILDAAGLPVTLPAKIGDRWDVGAAVRVQAAFEARFFDIFAIAVAPSAGFSWAGTPSLHLGLSLRPTFVYGLGPT